MSLLSKKNVLAACVFIDLFAVSLVVPLLPGRYKDLGITPVAIGMMGSVYSIAQIFGGLAFGVLGDQLDDRRTVLFISFMGAAFSYALVGVASNLWMLVASRLIVGAVKQTMTASKAMASQWSDDSSRAEYIGTIGSAATAAWVIGSGVTGILQSVHPAAPSAVAVLLYAVDALVVASLLPRCATRAPLGSVSSAKNGKGTGVESARPSFLASARQAFGNGRVGRFVVVKVLYGLVARASMSMQDVWELDRFGLKTGQLGQLRTAKSVLSVATQGLVAGRLMRALGERRAFAAAVGLALVGDALEYTLEDVTAYTALAVPAKLVSGLLGSLALESLMTKVSRHPPPRWCTCRTAYLLPLT